MPRSPNSDHDPDDEAAPAGTGNVKLQRWVDLLAALLVRAHPATFVQLAPDVPEYGIRLEAAKAEPDEKRRKTLEESLKRAFERDKDELRALGVPIESVADENGNPGNAYRLRRRDFYLPYLCFAVPGGQTIEPDRPDQWGYQTLTSLTFEPDELQAVVDAAAGVRALGDPLLAADADSALRKLAVDLPVDVATASPDAPRVVLPRQRADAAAFEALGDALTRRKLVRFGYHAMSTDRHEEREVEPYGLVFLNGHWYLVAHDRGRGAMRNFRLNRVADVRVNTAKPNSPDYEIPDTFRLRDHARSRQAWELGDSEATSAVAEFRGESGPTVAAARLGAPVEGFPGRRRFEVRRIEPFVRWLLSFAGEVVPVAPEELVARYAGEVRRTSERYAAAAPPRPAPPSPTSDAGASPRARPHARTTGTGATSAVGKWQPKGAAAQLRRILHVVPQLADGEEHSIAEVAARIGTDPATLRRDIFSLVNRYDTPAGFVEGVSVFYEADRVSAFSNHLLRPMRLTVSELCALDLGLAVLRAQRPPDEQAPIDRARQRLEDVIARLPDDPLPDGLHGASLGDAGSTAQLAEVRRALRERRRLRLVYRKSGSTTAAERVVCPYALVAATGNLYVVAYGADGDGLRIFRMDRVESAAALDDVFEPRADFSLDLLLQDGRLFHRPDAGTMHVRYSPRVARWIAEREGRELEADGSLELEHPLADLEWGVRHVLQYGAEAEVLAPVELRARLQERLAAMEQGASRAIIAST